jgi:MoaA/NifB/PqqE/SkfB family radical SAM enzyme
LYRVFRRYGEPRLPPLAMSFVVTDRCNSLCKTCNIGRRFIDDPSVADGELTLEEYTRLFGTLARLMWVTFSGGEPFMRGDFPEIVARLAEMVRPSVINIPTNATLVRGTTRGVEQILGRLGETRLVVNVSLDGVGRAHDRVRGFEGNFALAERTLAELRALGDPRLTLGVNTVLSRFNIEHADEIFDYVLGKVRPDSYVVELAQIRPEYHNQDDAIAPDPALAARAIDSFLEKSGRHARHGVSRLVRAFRHKYYADVKRELVDPVGHECFSAFATCSVTAHGQVWSNTQRADLMGDLRDFDFDFRALWRSPLADAARAKIRAERCHCETSNVAYSNTLMNPRALPEVLYRFVGGSLS